MLTRVPKVPIKQEVAKKLKTLKQINGKPQEYKPKLPTKQI